MENKVMKFYSKAGSNIILRAIPGHFATSHSHINYYVDMTGLKTRRSEAAAVGKAFVQRLPIETVVDTIVCLDGCEVIGAYMAEELEKGSFPSMNMHNTVYVVTPEFNVNNQMIFRDSSRALVMVFKPSTLSCATITASGSARFTMPSSSGQSAQPVTSASTSFSSKHWRAKSINCSRSAPSPSQTIMLHIGGLLPVQIAFYTFSIGKKAAVFKGVAAT